MKRIFIGAASLLMSFALSAAEVGTEDVELVAKGWVRDNAAAFGQLGAFRSVKAELDAAGQPLWYWVVMEKGTVIVAPDDEIEPVIAVLSGCDGTLPANHPMRALLQRDLTRRVALAKAQQTSGAGGRTFLAAPLPKSPTAAKWQRLIERGNPRPSFQAASHVVDTPATVVKWLDGWNEENDKIRCWTQEDPFNAYTPEVLVDTPLGKMMMHCVVGCVATAGASVLHYFRVPEGCASNRIDYCYVNDGTGNCRTNLYTKGGAYDWSLFDTSEEPEVPEISILPIIGGGGLLSPLDDLKARVSFDVGLLSHMNYSPLMSGATGYNLSVALRTHFGLKAARYVGASQIASDYYPALVYNQIRAGSPVIFGIDSSTATEPVGHEVVACGYGIDADNADYTFIFCGWAGLGDAWYALPHIDTKATAGGSNAAYDTIDGMIVSLSTNACYVPLVGRVVDTDGNPVTEPLTLADGTLVQPDENGYWGVRIDPGMAAKVIYDPVGDPHAFTVGPDAATPKYYAGTYADDVISPAKLAAALPKAMEIVVKRELIGKKLTVVADYETAVREALAGGKLLYVFGGSDTAAVEALKGDFRANSNETFFSECVFWQVDANRYQKLGNSPFFAGTVDPRTFDPNALWSAENGQWTEGLDAWKATNRKPKSGGLTLTGPVVVNAAAAGSYQYVLTVVYEDGVTNSLSAALVDWTVSPAGNASIALGYLTPVPNAAGPLTVTADVSTLFGASGLSVGQAVTLTDGFCRIIGGCRTNTCIIAVDDDPNVLKRALEIAQGDASNRGLITPAFNKTTEDPFVTEVQPGTGLHLEMQASRTFDKSYVLRCVGLEVTADGQVVTNVTFDADAESKTVSYDYEARGAVTRVGWKWQTDKYYVKLDSNERAKLDCGTGYYPAGSNLVVGVTPGTDVEANKDWVAIWRGCSRAEAGVSNATLKVDAVRDVWATVANVSNKVAVASTNGLMVAKGYKIELIEVKEGNPDWDEPTTYDIRVVYYDGPETVDPDPVAFTSIEKVGTEWVLVATNAKQWCEYSLWGGTTLKTNEWTEVVSWEKWNEPDGPITNRVTVTDDAQWFWILRARPGEKPAE